MAELFRCDYCGQHSLLDKGSIYWSPAHRLDNGDLVFTPAVYCSGFCGRRGASSDSRVGGR